jgi:MFS transporter, OPA family, sugar phosphate sensor protein UhpC
MIRSLFSFFAPAPHLPVLDVDEKTLSATYKSWRIRTLYSMFIGYALYYFTRKSFTFAMPGIIADLGYTKAELGILGSVLAISYGFSKFFSGILSDRSSPRYFMAFGLMATGIINIIFGMTSSLVLFSVLWALNGWFQGFGWPACSRMLVGWYSKSERGAWWSTWNVCHNVGMISIAVLAGFLLQYFGWRYGMFIPGLICIAGGFLMINRLRDCPESVGLPPIDVYRNDITQAPEAKKGASDSLWTQLVNHVFTNKYLWLLGFAYFFVYFVRTAMADWTSIYLIETRGYEIKMANVIATMMEWGGFLGSLAAGWMSDRIFGARRGPVNILFSAGMVLSLMLFSTIASGSYWQESMVLALSGFMIFGPQMLIGVHAVELATKETTATASGFVCCISYLGAACAGYPLGKIIQEFGWSAHFSTITIASAMALVLLLPLWKVKERAAPALAPA